MKVGTVSDYNTSAAFVSPPPLILLTLKGSVGGVDTKGALGYNHKIGDICFFSEASMSNSESTQCIKDRFRFLYIIQFFFIQRRLD